MPITEWLQHCQHVLLLAADHRLLLLAQARGVLPNQEINLASSCMRLMEAHLDAFRDGSAAQLAEMPEAAQVALVQAAFLFALIWSVGGNTDEEGRKVFDAVLRKVLAGEVPPELKHYMQVRRRGAGCSCAVRAAPLVNRT
jgi:hypothetical protein